MSRRSIHDGFIFFSILFILTVLSRAEAFGDITNANHTNLTRDSVTKKAVFHNYYKHSISFNSDFIIFTPDNTLLRHHYDLRYQYRLFEHFSFGAGFSIRQGTYELSFFRYSLFDVYLQYHFGFKNKFSVLVFLPLGFFSYFNSNGINDFDALNSFEYLLPAVRFGYDFTLFSDRLTLSLFVNALSVNSYGELQIGVGSSWNFGKLVHSADKKEKEDHQLNLMFSLRSISLSGLIYQTFDSGFGLSLECVKHKKKSNILQLYYLKKISFRENIYNSYFAGLALRNRWYSRKDYFFDAGVGVEYQYFENIPSVHPTVLASIGKRAYLYDERYVLDFSLDFIIPFGPYGSYYNIIHYGHMGFNIELGKKM